MQETVRELTAVEYSPAGVKLLHFQVEQGRRCFRLHWHDRMELIWLRHGTLEIAMGEEPVLLEPSELYIIPPKMPHTAIAKSDAQYDVIMFDVRAFYNGTRLSSEFLEPIFSGTAKFELKTGHPEIIRCCNELIDTCQQDSLLTVSLIYKLLGLLFGHCLLASCSGAKAETVITDAIRYMEENYAEKITTKALAEKYGYSSEHFCRKFKEEIWLSPMEYLKTYRLEASTKLLKNRRYTITEVAMHCGFNDANYFTRCFKAHFGISPVKYKQRASL